MIWTHETTIDIGRAEVTVGWDIDGEDYEGSDVEPPTHAIPDWEQIAPDIALTNTERAMVNCALAIEMERMKDSAEEDAAESRAFDRAIDNDLYMERMR